MGTYVVCAAGVILVVPDVLRWLNSNTTLLPAVQLIGLLALVGMDLFVGMHSAILKTGNETPHLMAFVVSGILTVLLSYTMGRLWQVWGILIGAFLAQAAATYWLTPYLCWRRLLSGGQETGKCC
jgi:hypothetical protein